jgi:hypothetical protein
MSITPNDENLKAAGRGFIKRYEAGLTTGDHGRRFYPDALFYFRETHTR